MLRKALKVLLIIFLSLIGFFAIILILLFARVTPSPPDTPTNKTSIYADKHPSEIDSGLYVMDNNWIRQNRYGLWEMYIEGNGYDRGVAAGKLSEHLVRYQEEAFVSQINNLLLSKHYQRFLLTLIAWLNKNLTDHIKDEYLKEIYGISLSASSKFEHFGPAYLRLLNYHAAHDIGHAMQSYYLVECTSFAAWDGYTKDSTLLVGRNFDFYFGDDFARNKMIEFVSPDSGYNFAFVTWGGMIGVVSGMNDQGLAVTINAGTLEIGKRSSTPVTLVAREILQYANDIDKAIRIAGNSRIMVSESFLISSAKDKKAIIIEKKPGTEDIAWPDSSLIICTNHFQGKEFIKEEDNIANRENNATGYRYERMRELIDQQDILDPLSVATILRDKQGLNNTAIGYGNEKAINQLLAHHSVIFDPANCILWVSTSPSVMGVYLAYDLNKIFSSDGPPLKSIAINEPSLTIPEDPFINSSEYENYHLFKSISDSIIRAVESGIEIPEMEITYFKTLNPEYFETYLILGDYYFSKKKYSKAREYYEITLTKEYNSKSVQNYLVRQITKCN